MEVPCFHALESHVRLNSLQHETTADVSSYERFLELLVMNGGGTIGYTTGDVTRLLDDAQLIQPEFMAGVPRVWNRQVSISKTVTIR